MIVIDKDVWGMDASLPFHRLLEELRSNGRKEVPERLPKIFLLTTSTSNTERNELKLAGLVDNVLMKPLRLNMLIFWFKEVLGIGKKRQRNRGKPLTGNLLRNKRILVVDDNVINRKRLKPLSRADETSTLLQFKQTFSIDKSASSDPSSYPKDGVECDQDTGHVIGLDLSSSFLYGFLNSSSSLFSLVHLQRLNLADNDFNYSCIQSEIGHLSRLTSLNLSLSLFSGQIPLEISKLSKLVLLDLSYNFDPLYDVSFADSIHSSKARLLKLEKFGLRSLLQNLTNLKELHVSKVIISSEVPHTLANLTSLTTVVLEDCGLRGEFPVRIFHLPKLQVLNLCYNENLIGHLPKFHLNSPLQDLELAVTNFSGKLPDSIGNLNFLKTSDFTECYFSRSIPASLGNLTQLTDLFLSYNLLQGPIPSSFSELKNLKAVYLSYNNLSVSELEIFFKLKNLTELNLSGSQIKSLTKNTTNTTLPKFQMLLLGSCNLREFPDFIHFQHELEVLYLHENNIHGQIPSWFLNTISFNKLARKIPPLLCRLSFLHTLDLSNNNLSGIIPPCLSNFSDSLSILNLKGNNFHGPIPHPYNKGNTLKMIDFSRNQLQGKVPRSLASCTVLEILDLSNNLIKDTFPFWLGVLTKLQVLILRSNKFYGAIGSHETKLVLPNLRIIDLSHNGFTGDLPVNYFQNWNAMKFFDMDNMTYMHALTNFPAQNNILGQESYSYTMTITNKGVNREYEKILNIFIAIDFSSNKFKEEIPESIGNVEGLQLLNLSNNDLSGGIPSYLANLTKLESLDLSQNKLSGELPQQLVLLTFLAFLNVSNNHLTGPIPQWKQFNTFENNSYEGNSGLCGDPLSTKCGMSEAPPPSPSPPLNSKQDNDSAFLSAIDWIIICMGYVSGIVVGMVIGHTITTKYHEWFIETFGRKQRKPRREKRRRQGNRS
ncbi:hypothetical protein ACSBR2_011878 [Camellia fascicularis]